MKKPMTPTLSLAALLMAALPLHADNFTLHMDGSYPWNSAPWQVGGSPGGAPGVNDSVIDITTDGTVRDLYLNGDQELVNFGRTSTGGYRIYNGYGTANTSDSTLTASGTFLHGAATVYIRSNPNGGRLGIDVGNLVIGSSGTSARFMLGADANLNYQRIDFNVRGTTTITGLNAALEITEGLSSTLSTLNFGHLQFDNSLSGGSPGIALGSGILQLKSLNSGDTSAGTIRQSSSSSSAGTLRITGDAGDAAQPPGVATFYSRIMGGVRLEKTGSNVQILAPHSGNSNNYSGGTLISGGVLSVRGGLGGSLLGTGAVEVANGGTLAGNGGIILSIGNAVTIKSGGTLAPGADGQGINTLVINGYNSREEASAPALLKMESGSAFTFNVDDDGNSDKILFGYYRAGGLELEGDAITVNITGQLSDQHVYTLFEFKSGGPISSGFVNSGLAGGLIAGNGFDGYNVEFHYDQVGFGGPGVVSMSVTAIPEGKAAWFLPLGMVMALAMKGTRVARSNAQ